MTRSKRRTEIRYTRQVSNRQLTLDLWPPSSSGGGLIIAELGLTASRSPALSLLLEGGLNSPEPASVFCVRALRVLRADIPGNASREVERDPFVTLDLTLPTSDWPKQTHRTNMCKRRVFWSRDDQ